MCAPEEVLIIIYIMVVAPDDDPLWLKHVVQNIQNKYVALTVKLCKSAHS
jgi:hypothetical protein